MLEEQIESITEGSKPSFLLIGPSLLIVAMFLPYTVGMETWIATEGVFEDDIFIEVPSVSGFDALEGDSTKMLIATILTVIPLIIFLANKYEGMEQIVTGCFAGVAVIDLVFIMDILDAFSDAESFPVGIGLILNIIIAGFFGYVSYKAAGER